MKKQMKDIFNGHLTMPCRNNIIFKIIKDNKKETYSDKILRPKIIGLAIDDFLNKNGYKAIFVYDNGE